MRVLAIDLGLRTGFALFGSDGLLHSYRSTHFQSRAAMKRAAWDVIAEFEPTSVVAEGDANLASVWRKVAEKQGAEFELVVAETWREEILHPRQRRDGATAKAAAMELALDIIDAGSAPAPTGELTTDVAEAILIGQWAVDRPR